MQPLLVKMTNEEFEAIPSEVVPRTTRLEDPHFESDRAMDWIVSGYLERLIFKNKAIHEILVDVNRRNQATTGQQILYALSALDGEVRNGGIEQFFWNCPNLIFDVSDALDSLRFTELREAYDRAVESLVGQKDHWHDLRKRAYSEAGKPDWEPFRQSYELLDVDWFNDAFFDKHDPSDYSRVVRPGLSAMLLRRLVEYVQTHRNEFLET
jgi:hypothetical protein